MKSLVRELDIDQRPSALDAAPLSPPARCSLLSMAFAMGEELLAEPVDFEVGPDSVQHLSTAQLAIASLRTDLDVLVRQRAYGIYLTRQNAARVGTLRPGDERELSTEVQEPDWPRTDGSAFDQCSASSPIPLLLSLHYHQHSY